MRAGDSEAVYLDLDTLGTPDERLTAVDVREHVDVRERAIACHRSQSSPFDGLSPELRRAFLPTSFIQESEHRGDRRE
jgi:LmbE family N-acetylglucosaminyl deacetylase